MLIMVTTLVIFVVGYSWILFGPAARTVDLTVSVVDSVTGAPVPNASVVIRTYSYGIFDDRQLTFVQKTDKEGNLAFKQPIGYALARILIVSYDQNIMRRGIDSRVTYAAYPVTGPRPGKYIHFYPNRRHYGIQVVKLSEAERAEAREWYKHSNSEAETTVLALGMRGIQVEYEDH
jgi:hypothetical protein